MRPLQTLEAVTSDRSGGDTLSNDDNSGYSLSNHDNSGNNLSNHDNSDSELSELDDDTIDELLNQDKSQDGNQDERQGDEQGDQQGGQHGNGRNGDQHRRQARGEDTGLDGDSQNNGEDALMEIVTAFRRNGNAKASRRHRAKRKATLAVEIQAHVNDGKKVVFLMALLIRSAKEVLLGDRPTARDSERALASLFDILQPDSSSKHYRVALVWAGIDMASTCHSGWTYLVSRWPWIEMRIHMRWNPSTREHAFYWTLPDLQHELMDLMRPGSREEFYVRCSVHGVYLSTCRA